MTYNEACKLVKKLGGWMEGDVARFPSVAAKEQFERYAAECRVLEPELLKP